LKIQDGGGRHLEKSKSRHISPTVRPIAMKFAVVKHFVPLDPAFRLLKIRNLKIQDGGGLCHENRKSSYVISGLIDHREILRGDAYWHVDAYLPYLSKIQHGAQPRVLTNKKSRYVDKGLTDQDDLTVVVVVCFTCDVMSAT